MGRWGDRCLRRQTTGWEDRQTDRHTHTYVDGQTGRWTDARHRKLCRPRHTQTGRRTTAPVSPNLQSLVQSIVIHVVRREEGAWWLDP